MSRTSRQVEPLGADLPRPSARRADAADLWDRPALPAEPGIIDRPSRRRATPRRARDLLLRPRLLLEDPLLLACVLLMLCAFVAAVGLVALAP